MCDLIRACGGHVLVDSEGQTFNDLDLMGSKVICVTCTDLEDRDGDNFKEKRRAVQKAKGTRSLPTQVHPSLTHFLTKSSVVL